jgi:vacuolar protein sorting-associated protein VTA1
MAAQADPLGNIPPNFKSLQHYIKTAAEHDKRDPAIAYYCRLYAMQKGMEIDRKSPDCRAYLATLMNSLEQAKKQHKDNEAMQSDMVGQAHVENYALKLFVLADNDDRAGRFGKNVVKLFYTAGMLMDVLTTFGELSEDIEKDRKYAKWKAAYIHNCLKSGETPHAGPLDEEDDPLVSSRDMPPASFGGGGSGYPGDQSSNSDFNPGGSSSFGPGGGYGQGPPDQGGYNQQPPASRPQQPSPAPRAPVATQPSEPVRYQPPPAAGGVKLKPEDFTKAMKYCKFATSALQYEDSKTALENLGKAVTLLSTGHD